MFKGTLKDLVLYSTWNFVGMEVKSLERSVTKMVKKMCFWHAYYPLLIFKSKIQGLTWIFFAEIFIMQVYQAIVATPDTLVKTLLSFYPLQKYCLSWSKKTRVKDLYALNLAHDTYPHFCGKVQYTSILWRHNHWII